ncbi:MAG TPA: hypothetical protein VND64_01515 [Pirellulales bacterium]|nr:hypothetical protein [Pirellulales bacterium]
MTSDQKLADVITALESAGVHCLVMGGHAVRYYGLDRTTDDFDLHLAPDCWDDLTVRISRSDWFRNRNPVEVASWRVASFRRFQIGTLPSGREEWLEFWKENHLLPPFEDLFARREVGPYGGRECDFLSLPDLIRSKETEREKDWLDIQYLEEFHDARVTASVRSGIAQLGSALAQLRSRRGLETHLLARNLDDSSTVAHALSLATNPITVALLLPAARHATLPAIPIETAIVNRLRTLGVGSPLHLTLVEAVRRRYKQDAMQVDKADKQAIRARTDAKGE